MQTSIKFSKSALLLVVLMIGLSYTSMATTYTALISGNWSNTLTWGGSAAPAFNITGADSISIPFGVIVTQDADVVITNASAKLAVAGTLTSANNLTMTAGTLSGTGTVVVNDLTVGAGGLITSVGTINASQLANSQAALVLGAVTNVSNKVILTAGSVALTTGGALNLASNVTLNMAGGAFNVIGGLPTLAGTYNLLYSGAVSTIGTESALTGLQNVTIDLATATNQIALAAPLSVTGVLALQQGVLNLAGNTLTIVGGVTTTTGSIAGSATSNLIINGTGSIGSIAFAAGSQTLNNLTIAIAGGGSVSLASDLTVSGITSLTSGSLDLNGHNLTIGGTIAAAGLGTITGSSTSGITVNGPGAVGTLMLSPSGNTLGNLTVNTTGITGNVMLGNDLTVTNVLTTRGGSLSLNGHNLTVSGTINSSGTGSISGSLLSNVTFNGTGSAGTLVLTPLSQTINNLTMNVGSAGNLVLGSPATVAGVLTLAQGNIDIAKNDLTLLAAATLTGGSAASYIVTSDTGSLFMTVANAGASGLYQVGTAANYAPVTVTNNSTVAGTFNVLAHPGVWLNGVAGPNIAQFQPVVNTTWNVESSIVTGADVDLKMVWSAAMQANAFDNTQAYVSHYTAGAWNTSTVSAATAAGGLFSMTLSGVTSFSPFAVFGRNIALGVVAVNSADMLQIYPNPSADKLTIQTGATNDKTNVEISDISGQIVGRYILSSDNNTIAISDLSTGSYFIKVSNSQINTVKKFTKI